MEILQRADGSVTITGYVNAVERKSRVMQDRSGEFQELIKAGTFSKAMVKNPNVLALVDHNPEQVAGSQADGTLKLEEDAIGLRAELTTSNEEAVKAATNGQLRGWSFGFYDVPGGVERKIEDGVTVRIVSDMELVEVSIIDEFMLPAYVGTTAEVRADEKRTYYGEICELETRAEENPPEAETPQEEPQKAEISQPEPDYKLYDDLIAEMRT